jgi:tetratricopeptide (TPR) repeat protein
MATQAATEIERGRRRGDLFQGEGGADGVSQRDTWKKFVDSLSQQFGEAIDPVLADLPQRMAKAIEANLTKDGEPMARFLPQDPGESGRSQDERRIAYTGTGSAKRGDDGTDAASPTSQRGGDTMARATTASEERDTRSRGSNDGSERRSDTSIEARPRAHDGQKDKSPDARRRRRAASQGYQFDAIAASRAELIRLAASWSMAGAPFQAVRIYTQVLERYPNSGAAVAAAEELVNLAETLQQRGMYFTAAGILDKLYQYS